MTAYPGKSGVRSEINVTPLIDVLLVLLIIFMVITPLTPRGLQADIPGPEPAQPRPNEPAIVLEVMREGILRLNTVELGTNDLNTALARVFASRADKVLFIKADKELEYRDVARIIDTVRGADPSIQVGL